MGVIHTVRAHNHTCTCPSHWRFRHAKATATRRGSFSSHIDLRSHSVPTQLCSLSSALLFHILLVQYSFYFCIVAGGYLRTKLLSFDPNFLDLLLALFPLVCV